MTEQNVTVSDNGRIVLPVTFRKQLNIKPGDELILTISSENEIIVHSPKQSLAKLQDLVVKKRKKNLVEAVIDMRRNENI
jgi:AbrB family looped-hinge helix DNA binding protein